LRRRLRLEVSQPVPRRPGQAPCRRRRGVLGPGRAPQGRRARPWRAPMGRQGFAQVLAALTLTRCARSARLRGLRLAASQRGSSQRRPLFQMPPSAGGLSLCSAHVWHQTFFVQPLRMILRLKLPFASTGSGGLCRNLEKVAPSR
jgi:hypothetical protein